MDDSVFSEKRSGTLLLLLDGLLLDLDFCWNKDQGAYIHRSDPDRAPFAELLDAIEIARAIKAAAQDL